MVMTSWQSHLATLTPLQARRLEQSRKLALAASERRHRRRVDEAYRALGEVFDGPSIQDDMRQYAESHRAEIAADWAASATPSTVAEHQAHLSPERWAQIEQDMAQDLRRMIGEVL